MRGRSVSLVAFALVVGLVTPANAIVAQTPAAPIAPESSAPSFNPTADEARFVLLINEERAKTGLPPLAVVPELVTVGQGWSAQMIAKNGGSDPCQVVHNPGFSASVKSNWRRLGENVGCGNADADFMHKAFVNSPPHYKNIVDPTYDSIGIGIVYDGDVMFVTEQFMDLRDGVATTKAPGVLALASGKAPKVSVKGTKVSAKATKKARRK
jgi:uncharacterized protein YkwD